MLMCGIFTWRNETHQRLEDPREAVNPQSHAYVQGPSTAWGGPKNVHIDKDQNVTMVSDSAWPLISTASGVVTVTLKGRGNAAPFPAPRLWEAGLFQTLQLKRHNFKRVNAKACMRI